MTSYAIASDFRKGYWNKPDITNIAPGVLVVGSQNVLINDGERVAARKGYALDGQAGTGSGSDAVLGSFDWVRHLGDERNLRAYSDELEYRYVAADGAVTWRRLADGFTSPRFNFAVFWDSSELIERLLMVNGTPNIFDWSGGVTTFASATASTLTKQGSTTWAQEGFYSSGTRQVTVGGITYTYTGGEGSTTITGVTPDPTLGGHAPGDVIHQTIRTTPNASMSGIPATLPNALIEVLNNQVYVGSLTNNQSYVSKQNSFTDYTFSNPRLPGEGALLTLDAPPTAYVPQEEFMYIGSGQDFWFEIGYQLSSDNAREAVKIRRLKTTVQQAPQSQALVSKIKNEVVFVSFEPSLDTLGRIELVQTPQTGDISDPVKRDFDSYDFTDGSVKYHRNFVYISVPTSGVVRIYNQALDRWEAPQVLPVGRFAVIGGELYGHSSQTNETYRLFDGYSDNGNPIRAVARFSYQNFGKRANKKHVTEWYTEGYISASTDLTLTVRRDFAGSEGLAMYPIDGADAKILFDLTSDGSLGKKSLGKRSLAGRGPAQDSMLPPKFRQINGLTGEDFFEVQCEYSSDGVDQVWELLAFGPDAVVTTATNAEITK